LVRRFAATAIVVAIAGVVSSCAVPTVAISSPYYGASAPTSPGSLVHAASVAICSPLGGPITLVIDVANPDSNTELQILPLSTPGRLEWGGEMDEQFGYFRDGRSHYEFTSEPLPPGLCPAISIRSQQFHSSDPAETKPFTFSLAW
jgi:hypothetical protein